MPRIFPSGGGIGCALALSLILLTSGIRGLAQEGNAPPAPENPAGSISAAELIERFRKMEERIDQVTRQNAELSQELGSVRKRNEVLSEDNQKLSKKYDELSKKVTQGEESDAGANQETSEPVAAGTGTAGAGGVSSVEMSPAGKDRSSPGAQDIGNRRLGKLKIDPRYNYARDGFQLTTEDDEFHLKFRYMIQADARIFEPADRDPVSSGFYIPRARVFFTGHMTKPIEYELSFQRSLGSFDLLNAFVNFNYDERFQFQVGRYKTPFTYEYYRISVQYLLAPERSLFNINFQGNRQIGMMGWGTLFGNRLEYAVGAFDGPRNSYQDFNHSPNVMAFLNFKPFERREDSFLRNFNVGGSVYAGQQNNAPFPSVISTNQQVDNSSVTGNSATSTATVPMMAFNNNVLEKGWRSLWDLHMAYYYKGLSVLGSWDGGFEEYAIAGSTHRPVRVPVGGYYLQAAYFLTGETINQLTLIDPIRPFDLRRGKFGYGAIQPTARFSELDLGNQVFTGGLADANLWTNRAWMTDIGVNWYLNKYIKVYFDWNHVEFAQPVYYAPGPKLQKTSDLFWLRMQLYF